MKNPAEQELEWMKQLEKDGYFIQHVPNPTHLMCVTALTQNPHAIQYLKHPTRALWELAIAKDPTVIQYVGNWLGESLLFQAVKRQGEVLRFIRNPSHRLTLEAAKNNPHALMASKALSEELVLTHLMRPNHQMESEQFSQEQLTFFEQWLFSSVYNEKYPELKLIRESSKQGKSFTLPVTGFPLPPVKVIHLSPTHLQYLPRWQKSYRLCRYAIRLKQRCQSFSPYHALEQVMALEVTEMKRVTEE